MAIEMAPKMQSSFASLFRHDSHGACEAGHSHLLIPYFHVLRETITTQM